MKTTFLTLTVACVLSLVFLAAEKRCSHVAPPAAAEVTVNGDLNGLCLNYEPSGPGDRQRS
jgi:hypothetical protein